MTKMYVFDVCVSLFIIMLTMTGIVSANNDTTSPVTTISLSGTNGSNGWYISDVVVTLSATDKESGINSTYYKIGYHDWIVYSDPFILDYEGINNVYYYSTDNTDNKENANSILIKIDKTPPIVTPPSNVTVNATGRMTRSVDIGWPIVSDISSFVITKNALSQYPVGVTTITWNVTDQAGLSSTVDQLVTIVDSGPVITLNGDSNVTIEVHSDYTDKGAKAIDAIDGDLTFRIEIDNPVNTSALGIYNITYNVDDWKRNPADQVIRTVNVTDTTPPNITMTGNNVTIEALLVYEDEGATAEDNYDGDLTKNIAVDNPVNTDVVGTYIVTYNVVDLSNNSAIQVNRTVNVTDTIQPRSEAHIFGVKDNNDYYASNVRIVLIATDAGSGVNRIEYRTNGDNWTNYTYPLIIYDNGSTTVEYFAIDNYDNREFVNSLAVNVYNPLGKPMSNDTTGDNVTETIIQPNGNATKQISPDKTESAYRVAYTGLPNSLPAEKTPGFEAITTMTIMLSISITYVIRRKRYK